MSSLGWYCDVIQTLSSTKRFQQLNTTTTGTGCVTFYTLITIAKKLFLIQKN